MVPAKKEKKVDEKKPEARLKTGDWVFTHGLQKQELNGWWGRVLAPPPGADASRIAIGLRQSGSGQDREPRMVSLRPVNVAQFSPGDVYTVSFAAGCPIQNKQHHDRATSALVKAGGNLEEATRILRDEGCAHAHRQQLAEQHAGPCTSPAAHGADEDIGCTCSRNNDIPTCSLCTRLLNDSDADTDSHV